MVNLIMLVQDLEKVLGLLILQVVLLKMQMLIWKETQEL